METGERMGKGKIWSQEDCDLILTKTNPEREGDACPGNVFNVIR